MKLEDMRTVPLDELARNIINQRGEVQRADAILQLMCRIYDKRKENPHYDKDELDRVITIGTKAWTGVNPSEFVAEQRGRLPTGQDSENLRIDTGLRCPNCQGIVESYETSIHEGDVLYCRDCEFEGEVTIGADRKICLIVLEMAKSKSPKEPPVRFRTVVEIGKEVK